MTTRSPALPASRPTILSRLAGLRRRAAFRNTFEPDAGYLKACAYKKEAAALGSAIPWIEEYLQTL